jgi:hypothetical protein
MISWTKQTCRRTGSVFRFCSLYRDPVFVVLSSVHTVCAVCLTWFLCVCLERCSMESSIQSFCFARSTLCVVWLKASQQASITLLRRDPHHGGCSLARSLSTTVYRQTRDGSIRTSILHNNVTTLYPRPNKRQPDILSLHIHR